MKIKIPRFLRLIYMIAKYSLIGSMEYRFQTVVRIVRILTEATTVLLLITLFFSHASTIAGYSKSEVILTYAIFNIIWATIYFFISDNLVELGDVIRRGNLDFYLLKPVDSQFMISCHQMHTQNILRILLGFGIAAYAVNSIHLILTPINLFAFLITANSGLIIGYSLMMFISVFSFWTFSSEIYELANTTFSIARYPLSIFPKNVILVFTIIPIIFITTVPTRALLGQVNFQTLITPLIALVSLTLARQFLFFALRHYQSASS